MKPPSSKKSESIEVRLPHAMKEAFMAHCQARRTTASAAIRGFVEAQLGACVPRQPMRRLARPMLAAGMLAASAPNFRPEFNTLDRNRDGVVDKREYGDVQPRFRACDCPLALPLKRISLDKGPRPFAVRKDDAAFATLDRNGDGQVSPGEFAAHRLTLWHQGYASLDRDGDGRLDAGEYAGAKKIVFLGRQPDLATFAELDRDRDGQIDWLEYLA